MMGYFGGGAKLSAAVILVFSFHITVTSATSNDTTGVTSATSNDTTSATNLTGCGNVPSIENGQIWLDNINSSSGFTASVTCYSGYTASSMNVSCSNTGEWDNVTCNLISCGDVPYIENGYISIENGSNTTFGVTANVTCHAGYTPSSAIVACLDTGDWANVSCDLISCGELPYVENGEAWLSNNTGTSTGDTATVSCNQGYSASSVTIICLESGDWENATCNQTGCGELPYVEHGEAWLSNNTGTSTGDTATVSCNQGYSASSVTIICLESGDWENATCNQTGCGELPYVENGEAWFSNNTGTSTGDTATVSCNQGYSASSVTIICLESGDWENATCNQTGCGELPYVENGEAWFSNNTGTSTGDTATVSCNQGYSASSVTIICLESGDWENATCNQTGCGELPYVENGEAWFSNNTGTSTGDTATVSCNQGYSASSVTIICLESGDWENATCNQTGCGELPYVENGEAWRNNNTGTSTGDTATVSCNQGYSASSVTIICLESGDWENATCNQTGCGELPYVENGEAWFSNNTGTSTGDTATVSCNQGYSASSVTIICLESGDWENATCNQTGCGELPYVENGEAWFSNNTGTSTGDTATVSCNQGYSASSVTIICLESGDWENATCNQTGCGELPYVENGEAWFSNNTGTSTGDTATVSCNQGYSASSVTIICLESGDWENATCNQTGCGELPYVENGEAWFSNNTGTSTGDTATVSCNQGYSASSVTIICLESGDWENATCNQTGCGELPYVENGEAWFSNNTGTSTGDTATVSCNQGYSASSVTIICLESGDWENATCNQTGCGELPYVENGEAWFSNNTGTSTGDTATVSCNQGYSASSVTIICLESGDWENATCNQTGCGELPYVENGEAWFSNNTGTSTGDTATVSCNQGYSASSVTIICLESGDWENATCNQTGCGELPYVENGEAWFSNNTGTSTGDTATVSCNQGYSASSVTIICLESGDWENATCNQTGCGELPYVENGEAWFSNNTGTSTGDTATVSCNQGYSASSVTIICLESGDWENATCNQTGCGELPYVENGEAWFSNNTGTSTGDTATVSCNQGYSASSVTIICLESGDWENATCNQTGCGDVPYIGNGEIWMSNNTNISFGDTATVTCYQGYAASSVNITCLESGDWENVTCDQIGCGAVPYIRNGEIWLSNNTNISFGDTAAVTCYQGYKASSVNISCLESGEWENVTCDQIDCGDVPYIGNGEIWLSNNTNMSFGDTATVTCYQGYTASSVNITCLESGDWENVTCDQIGCGDVPYIGDGEIWMSNNTNMSFGDTATVTCYQGYTASSVNITCLDSGDWENATCDLSGCRGFPSIENGQIWQQGNINTDIGETANVTCHQGYIASSVNITCLASGEWENVTCEPVDCGAMPYLANGNIVLDDARTTFGATASVDCDLGYSSNISSITCLASGDWDYNITCIINECDVSNIPSIDNGNVTINTEGNQSTASFVNVSCYDDYAATSPTIECLGQGVWQDDVSCVAFALGIVRLEAGQAIANDQHTAFLRCLFTIVDGLKYRIKWLAIGVEFHDTGILSSTEARTFVMADDMFTAYITTDLLPLLFGAQITCSASVFDGAGIIELENGISAEFVPLEVSTNNIMMMRGQDATFTVFLNLPFGCPTDSSDCFLRLVLYDQYDTYNCDGYSSIAVVSSDTCGGKIEGATPETIGQSTSSGTITNITITTKNNRWYRLRSYFRLVLQLSGVGNTKLIWNTPSTIITVSVTDNYLTRYRGCYSYVDPYYLTFDWRWYSNQLIEIFVMVRHTSLPIEIQTVTTRCNRYTSLTCSCAVTVRAGGDVFTINHCHGHLTGYLASRDGILRVYKTWSTSYLIILPTGMQVYVYVMPYLNYMMNIYVTPASSDFEQMEGLCGNFNGDYSDDTILRGTNSRSSVEETNGGWWWWSWWSDYFYPHDFAYSWGLNLTGRSDENLLNPDVYENVASWDNDKKLCVCPYAYTDNNYEALCSANEEATCTTPVWRYGTLIEVTSRNKRDVDQQLPSKFTATRLKRMRQKWHEANPEHTLRKKRDVSNDTALTYDQARQICEDQLNNDCDAYTKKENVSELSNSTDNLENCIRDTMHNGTEYITSHCDTFTQEVNIELEKDVDFTENNTELAEGIRNASCPGKCSGNGDCVEGQCVCYQDFATDLCLLNITAAPLLEELANEGVCDVSDGPCDYILIVGNGFIEGAICNMTIYGAGPDGIFNLTDTFKTNCTYLNYNELLAPTSESGSASRRRRDVTDTSNVTAEIATMVGVSVSNDGSHFSTVEFVVVLDSTCLQTNTNENNETIVTLKTGYCYIDGTCYTSGTFMSNSICDKCDTSNDLFSWSDGCDTKDSSSNNNLIIILASVGSALLVGVIVLVLCLYFYQKSKKARLAPLMVHVGSYGASNMRFWHKKTSNVSMAEHHLEGKKESRMAAEFIPDDEEIPGVFNQNVPNLHRQ